MKKLTVLSIVAASLLLVGCGDSATGADAKAASAEHKTEAASAHKTDAAPMKCGEGKCGDSMKKGTEAKCGGDKKSAGSEAKEAVTKAVEKGTEAVKETATKAVEAVKETATKAVDSTKAAAAAVATKATAAVAAATGPDGKALYAKCAGCHGADGKSKAMGKAAPVAGQSAADLETKIAGYKAGTLNSAGMGALMKGQVSSLNDADVKAIAAYMSGL